MVEANEQDELGTLLWRTWGALGARAWDTTAPAAAVDGEALILLTAAHGDQRLLHESIDWGIRHAHLLSAPRLRDLVRHTDPRDDDATSRTVDAWIATVATHATRVRWRAVDPDDVLEDFTPTSPEQWRAPTAPSAATAYLRLRALQGTTTRSDVFQALHAVATGTRAPMSTREVAAQAGAASPNVRTVLDDLVDANLVVRTGTPKRQRFEPSRADAFANAAWSVFDDVPSAPWRDATVLLVQLLALQRRVAAADGNVLVVAGARDAWARLAEQLRSLTGVAAPMPKAGAATEVGAELVQCAADSIRQVVAALVGDGSAR